MITYSMATKEERAALKAQKEAEKAAKKAAKDQEKDDKKAQKEAEKAAKKAAKTAETATSDAPVSGKDLKNSTVAVAAEPELKENVEFEGARVVKVLQDGRATETQFHCQMSDGTTKHVPKELFVK